MSIDGAVLCGCREEGRAAPPPCPVPTSGPWLYPVEDTPENRAAVEAWAETACPHPGFLLVDRLVRVQGLREAMASRGGPVAFPALHAGLPRGNDGELAPDAAAACLSELDTLRARMSDDQPPMAGLVDDDTGQTLWVRDYVSCGAPDLRLVILNYDEAYRLHSNPELGEPFTSVWLDPDGLIRIRDRTGHVVWHSRAFTQEVDGAYVIHRDRSSGAEIRHLASIPTRHPDDPEPPPARLRVEIRPYDIDVSIIGVDALRELFETSVHTGRPVYWW